MTPTDNSPPLDSERTPVRITVTSALLIAALAALVTVSITWGTTTERIDTIDTRSKQTELDVKSHDRQLVELQTVNREIARRLESIDRKIDAKQ